MNAIAIVPSIMTKDSALITGETPYLIDEYTYSGSVPEPGPLTKNVMTKSSRDIVTEISMLDAIAGEMDGMMTFIRACLSDAPRSLAASTVE